MRFLALSLSLAASPMFAHELWIAPTSFMIPADTIVQANLVNGEEFDGSALSYLPRSFSRFVMVEGGEFANVVGRLGDVPALQMDPVGDGLHVIAYITKPQTLDYKEWPKFQKFVDHKDLGDVRPIHDSRGLPIEGFGEVYIRYSKSLVGVGSAVGADRRLGMETEIVALNNPYVEAIDEMTLQLFYQQDVRANEQIEIFEKSPDGSVEITLLRTDAEGIANVPVKPGHTYMADAVVLREPSAVLAENTGAVWETLWANMTWAMP